MDWRQSHEQWKAIQAVHPRSTRTPHAEERSTEFLIDDDSPLVQPMIHAVVEVQLEPGLLLSACPLTQEGIDILQQPKELFLQSQEVLQEFKPDR